MFRKERKLTATTGPHNERRIMNDALKRIEPPMIPTRAGHACRGGNPSQTSHPTQSRKGIGIQRKRKVKRPIIDVIRFE
jgi:hypothetical protein